MTILPKTVHDSLASMNEGIILGARLQFQCEMIGGLLHGRFVLFDPADQAVVEWDWYTLGVGQSLTLGGVTVYVPLESSAALGRGVFL